MVKRGVFQKWFASYAVILLILLCSSSIFYIYIISTLEQEVGSRSAALFENTCLKINELMKTIDDNVTTVYLNQAVNQALRLDESATPAQQFLLREAREELKKYNIFTKTDDTYLYLYDLPKVIKSSGVYSRDLFYSMYLGESSISLEDWVSQMGSCRYKTTFFTNITSSNGRAQPAVAIAYPLPYEDALTPKGVLVNVIYESTLTSLLRESTGASGGQAFIVDRVNGVIAGTNPQIPAAIQDYHSLLPLTRLESPYFVSEDAQGEEQITIALHSDIEDWIYILQMPKKDFFSVSNQMRIIAITVSLAGMAMGLAIAYYSSKNHSVRLRRIADAVGAGEHLPGKNEYELIESGVSGILQEKETMKSYLDAQEQELAESFLRRLMEGQEVQQEEALRHGIQFAQNTAAALWNTDTEEERGAVLKTLREYCAAAGAACYGAAAGRSAAALVTYSALPSSDGGDIRLFFTRLSKILDTRCRPGLVTAISPVFHAGQPAPAQDSVLREVPALYQQALAALDYSTALSGERVICSHEVPSPETYYCYPIEYEQKVIGHIRQGDAEEASRMVGKIFDHLAGTSLQAAMARRIVYDIANTLQKSLAGIEDQAYLDKLAPLDKITSCKSLQSVREMSLGFVQEICAYVRGKAEGETKQALSAQITAFIQEHYSDCNLNITMIAETFHLTPRYLSRLFKLETGTELLDVVHLARVQKARGLLLEQASRLEDIAQQVGYINAGAFIKAFKKYMGVTPGAYRRDCSQKA